MIEPKLRLIPSAYKAGTLYSPLPSNGDGDFTFSRTGEATRVNQAGVIETVASNVPRLDYSDSSCPSLLLEPQRTNLIIYSEDFTNSAWTKTSVDITNSDEVSPSGDLNVKKMTGTATSTKRIFEALSTTASLSYTYSLYVKKGNTSLLTFITSSGSLSCTFNLDTLTASNGFIEDAGNGWYRLSATATASSTTEVWQILLNSADSAGTFQHIYGAQVEQGSYTTSYIPTSGSAVTRNTDVCDSAGNSNVFNDSEGVLYFESKGFVDIPASNSYIQLSKSGESSFTNSLVIQHRNNGFLRVYVNGSAGTDLHFNINIDFTQNHKIAILYKLNGYKLFIDGVAQSLNGTPTQTVFSGLDDLSFDLRGSTGWNGKIKDLRYYSSELTDVELTELTTL